MRKNLTHYFHEGAIATAVGNNFSVRNCKKLRVSIFGTGMSASKVTFKAINESGIAESISGTKLNGLTNAVETTGLGESWIFDVTGLLNVSLPIATFTENAKTAGTSVSDTAPSEDVTLSENSKFLISVDGDEAEEVTLDVTGLDTGAKIATALQTAIRALGGSKELVTVVFTTVYTVTSGTTGDASSVVITSADADDIAEELKLGVDNGGTETVGTQGRITVVGVGIDTAQD